VACRAGIITLFLLSSLTADPLVPWTGIDKLPYVTFYGGYWNLGSLPQRTAHNVWIEGIDFSLALDRDLQIDFDVEVAETDRQTFLYNTFDLSFSKLLMNDLIGDPFSLMLSFKMSNNGGDAVAEPALLHFGEWEWRAIVALGKEWTRFYDWWFRLSGYFSLGIANRGTPWLEEGFSFEQNFCGTQRYLLGIKALQAFGGHLIQRTPFVKGWGPYEFYTISVVGGFWQEICGVETGLLFESTVWNANYYSNITKIWLEFRLPLAF